ncbi:MAG: hypothetical protein ACJ8DJ_18365 [Gemmatimonadales bacterium]
MTIDTRIPVRDGTRLGSLWTANLLGPAAVLLTQELGYVLSEKAACSRGEIWPVHLAFAAGLALALTALSLGWREWRRWGERPSTTMGNPEGRTRFMSVLGVLVSSVSALVIVAMWSATMFLHPCQ